MLPRATNNLQDHARRWLFHSKAELRSLTMTSTFSSSTDSGKMSVSKTNDAFNESQATKHIPTPAERLFQVWNESSGTAEISLLKDEVAHASKQFDSSTRTVTESRREVDKKLLAYEEVHGRHASMLRVRDKWDGNDAVAFADLVGKEVQTRKELELARDELQKAETNVGKWQVEYMDAMRKRYHEEQIWQDKWRVFGTYGTWVLIGLNSIVFLGSQFFHQRREVGRLKAIETLINEKLPGSPEGGTTEVMDDDRKSPAAKLVVGEGEVLPSSQPITEASRLTADSSKNLVEMELSMDGISSNSEKRIISQGASQSTKPTEWVRKVRQSLKAMLVNREKMRGVDTSESSEKERSLVSNSKDAIVGALDAIHLPSALIGAAATAASFAVVSVLFKI